MLSASVRDLKNRTSEILKKAATQDVLITTRGKPVACLMGLEADGTTLELSPLQQARVRRKRQQVLKRLWRIKPEPGKKWIPAQHHDRALYGASDQ